MSTTDALGNLDATGVAAKIKAREISAKEALDAAIARSERVNGQLNFLASVNYDFAYKRAAEQLNGPFAGVPTLIKDLLPMTGLPVSFGCRAFQNFSLPIQSPYADAVMRSGLVPFGKSTTPEFGLTATTESVLAGDTRNPWNTALSSGGSSGGAAAAVAAGVVPVAHASDGGGSIRIPASCCGLFGLKVSRDRCFTNGLPDPGVSLSVNGCVSRSVRDTAAWLAATEDPSSDLAAVGMVSGANKKRLRIGLIIADTLMRDPQADVKSATHAVADLCAARGHDVRLAAWNIDGEKFADAFTLVWAALAAGAVMQGQAVSPGAKLDEIFEPLTLGLADRFNSVGPDEMAAAVAFIQQTEARYHAVFNDFDVILTPVLASTPPPIGELAPSRGMAAFERVRDYVAYTPLQNGAGAPAISVPLSMSPSGMPIGAHFAAARGQERILLELAYELEQTAPWADRKPGVWAGST